MSTLAWYRPALLRTLSSGYRSTDLTQDLLAGLLVGIVALPLSMGLAIASGCKPEQGLFTAIIGGLIVSVMGGSRVQIAGPAGAFVALCASGVKDFGYDGLALATMMAGALVLLMGVMRLGRAISFIPIPVVIGFTTGIAVIIASTQLGPALGIPEPSAPIERVHERLAWVWTHLGQAALAPIGIAIATITIIVGLRRISPRLPGAMIALVVVGGAAWAMDAGAATIESRYGAIPRMLPTPHLPALGLGDGFSVGKLLDRFEQLSVLALSIALLGSIESLLSAVVADGLAGDRHDSNTELVAQGTANLVSPLLLGLPVTGVIARTSTNIRAGARTPIAGIVHSATVLLAMVLFAPWVGHVPLACLAGILLVVCWSMAELRHWPHVLRAGRGDAVLLPLAFGLTVTIGLQWAVPIGVLLAMLFFVKRMSEDVRIERAAREGIAEPVPAGVEVYEVNGPFFFGAATLIRDLDHELDRRPRAMILRLGRVPFIDATAAFALRELIVSCQKKEIPLMLCELHRHPAHDLERHGLAGLLGPGRIHGDLRSALAATEPA
jgi:SulP family sulfate permease